MEQDAHIIDTWGVSINDILYASLSSNLSTTGSSLANTIADIQGDITTIQGDIVSLNNWVDYQDGVNNATSENIGLLSQDIWDLQAEVDAITPVVYNNPSFSNSTITTMNTSNSSNSMYSSTINTLNGDAYVEYNPKVYYDAGANTTTFFFDQTFAPSGATQLVSYGFDGQEHLLYKHIVAGTPTDVVFNLT